MRARLRTLGAALAVLVLAGCSAPTTGTEGFVTGDGSITLIAADERQPAPVIAGETLDGDQWSSESVTDKVIVYNVWGSWCGPCRAEAPVLQSIAEQTADRAVLVGLNTRDMDRAAPQAFVRANGVTFPTIFDPDGSLLLSFAGQLPPSAIPSTLLVDPQGRIAARVIGVTTEATLLGLIDDLAAGG